MRHTRPLIVRHLMYTLITLCAAAIFESSGTRAQTSSNPPHRSRTERIAEQRKVEAAFPDFARALRVLHLPPQKMAEARTILNRHEAETRAAREELQQLVDEQTRQGYHSRNTESPRVAELRTAFQQATDNLRAEIKVLLTPQQREQLDRHLQKRDRHKDLTSDPRGHNSRAGRGRP